MTLSDAVSELGSVMIEEIASVQLPATSLEGAESSNISTKKSTADVNVPERKIDRDLFLFDRRITLSTVWTFQSELR
jgi:hypothetical protein